MADLEEASLDDEVTIKADDFSEEIIKCLLYNSKELICWLCLENIAQNSSMSVYDRIVISGPQPTMVTFEEIIKNITGGEVEFSEIPHSVCSNCANKFIEHYMFMRECRNQNSYWQGVGEIATQIMLETNDNFAEDYEDNVEEPPQNIRICYKSGSQNKIEKLILSSVEKLSNTTIICPHCGKEINYNEYKKHIDIMHKWVKYATCEKCGKIFVNHGCYQRHKENCSKKHKAWNCLSCKKTFESENHLLNHKRLKCIGATCRNCGELLGKTSLQAHKKLCVFKKITKRKPPQFKCKFCSIEYVSRPHLRAHVYEVHSPRNKPCSVCGKLFKTNGSLNDHMKSHRQEKNYTCDFCGKMFASKRTLGNHIRLHTGIKPYSCFLCDEGFVTTSRRLDHMRKVHWEPQFECKICYKKFAIPSLLNEHQRRHTKQNTRLVKV